MPSFQIGKSFQQEVRNARMVGEFAVKVGVARQEGAMRHAPKERHAKNGVHQEEHEQQHKDVHHSRQ